MEELDVVNSILGACSENETMTKVMSVPELMKTKLQNKGFVIETENNVTILKWS